MFFKKQRSNDFVIGRLCLFPNANITLNDHNHLEYVHWIYILSGSIKLDYISNGICTDQFKAGTLVNLSESKENHVTIIAGDRGFAGIICMTEKLTDQIEGAVISIDKECNIDTADSFKIIIPLVNDLRVKKDTSMSYKPIPTNSVLRLPSNTSAVLNSFKTSVPNHALLFDKIS
jgi:hypothetical protein